MPKLKSVLYRKTDNKLPQSAINFLSAAPIHEAPFNVEIVVVVFSEVVCPVEPLIQHIEV